MVRQSWFTQMPSLSVVLPAYNEQSHLADAVDEVVKLVASVVPDLEIIVVIPSVMFPRFGPIGGLAITHNAKCITECAALSFAKLR